MPPNSRIDRYRSAKYATVAICLLADDESLIPFGTGVNVDPSGIVVTCKHVVEVAQARREESGKPPKLPKASQGVEYRALPFLDMVAVFTFEEEDNIEHGIARFVTMHGRHDLDIAVGSLKPEAPLPFLNLADSDELEEGELVFTCGFPLGPDLQPSTPSGSLFYRGIVSGIRPHHLLRPRRQIILDMSVNQGNSGGPLCSEDKEGVLGIVNARMTYEGLPTGIGMAVPSNLVKPLIDTIVKLSREDLEGISRGKWPFQAPSDD
jgi:S1-C subfamily serine protease